LNFFLLKLVLFVIYFGDPLVVGFNVLKLFLPVKRLNSPQSLHCIHFVLQNQQQNKMLTAREMYASTKNKQSWKHFLYSCPKTNKYG